MNRVGWIVMLAIGLAARGAGAADTPVGQWKTVDENSGAIQGVVEIYDHGGKLFGKIVGLTTPTDEQGQRKICAKCAGADRGKPIVGLVIIKDLAPGKDRWQDGTILDPDDGKIYKSELWVEGDKLKVRGYVGLFYRTQTWVK